MTRIIAGTARGRSLAVPPNGTRPTADRAREALFSAIESQLGGPGSLAGTHVLDLYAGSGAVGLEALSRGAVQVTFVESAVKAAAVIRKNVDTVGLPGATVLARSVESALAGQADGPYDVVFADPPYALATPQLTSVLESLAGGGWLSPGAVVVVERATRDRDWAWPPGFAATRSKAYGEATLWFATPAV